VPSAEEITAGGGAITAFVTGVVKLVQVSVRLGALERDLKALRVLVDAARREQLRDATASDPPDDSDAIAELRAMVQSLTTRFDAHQRDAEVAARGFVAGIAHLQGVLEGQKERWRR